MKCDGRPDPSSKKDINTFINLTKDDRSNTDMSQTLKTCEMVLEVSVFYIMKRKKNAEIFPVLLFVSIPLFICIKYGHRSFTGVFIYVRAIGQVKN